jgi:hypothetical protein
MHLAAKIENKAREKGLLEHEVDANLKDNNGQMPLDAMENDVVREMLQKAMRQNE